MSLKAESIIIRRICGQIKKSKRFLITGHTNPDGDCLGSELALGMMLAKMGKEVFTINVGSYSKELLFLPGVEKAKLFKGGDMLPGGFDVIFILDSGGISRLEEMEAPVAALLRQKNGPVLINIDHHTGNGNFGDINWVDKTKAAVGEMVFQLIKYCGVKVDRKIATNLYVSLDTDTGHFRFESTSPATHLIVAELLATGINISEIYKRIYEGKTYGEMKLFVECLSRIKLTPDGRIAWSVLTREMYKKFKSGPSDSQNYISQIKIIDGVKVAVLFRETQKDPLAVKVSIRTDSSIDAAELVRPLGGGGHSRASGVTMRPPIDKACKQLIQYIQKHSFLLDNKQC